MPKRPRGLRGLEGLGKLLLGIGLLGLALRSPKVKRILDAGGDPIEALHGHACGPGCIHYTLRTPKERRAWKKEMGWKKWPSEVVAGA